MLENKPLFDMLSLDLTHQRYEEKKRQDKLDAQINKDRSTGDSFSMRDGEEENEEQNQLFAYLFDDVPMPIFNPEQPASPDEESRIDKRTINEELMSRRGR